VSKQVVIVQVLTDLDETDEAIRSVLTNLKKAGYNYEDYRVLAPTESGIGSLTAFAHAALVVSEPDLDRPVPYPDRQPDPSKV
jgi:hypothetical protein